MVACDYCGHPVDVVRTRWRCTNCGTKLNCCDGAPAAQLADMGAVQHVLKRSDLDELHAQ